MSSPPPKSCSRSPRLPSSANLHSRSVRLVRRFQSPRFAWPCDLVRPVHGDWPPSLSEGRSRSRVRRLGFLAAGRKELPVPLGDDFDLTVGHFDRALIVDCVRRGWYFG